MNKTSLLELAKKLNIHRRSYMKTKDIITMYKEIIFGSDTPSAWHAWMNFESSKSLTKNIYDLKVMEDTMRSLPWEGLQRNIVIDDDTMIDKRTSEVVDLEVDSTYWKDKF